MLNNEEPLDEIQDDVELTDGETPEEVIDEDAPIDDEGEQLEESEGGDEGEPEEDMEFEVDITDIDGSTRTENVKASELKQILEGANRLLVERAQWLEEREQYTKYNQILNLVGGNQFVRSVVSYTMDGASPREIIETLYSMMDQYFPEGEQQESAQQEAAPVALPKEVQDKLSRFDNYLSEQDAARVQSENFSKVNSAFEELGYAQLEKDADQKEIGRILTDVTTEMLSELYPGKEPSAVMRSVNLPSSVLKSIWREVAARSGGKLRRDPSKVSRDKQTTAVARNRSAVRRITGRAQQESQSRQAPARGGASGGAKRDGMPMRTTASERASKLRDLMYGK